MPTYERSFASQEQAQFWHPTMNGDLMPRDVFERSGKRYWFKCGECDHDFDSILGNIVNLGRWCPYCANPPKKLCDDINCQICFNKSFASHEKSQFWHPTKNSTLIPRHVFKGSDKKCWFKCSKCDHDFDSKLSNIVCNNHWCPYCANSKICDYFSCQSCFIKSFASHKRSQFWHPTKNGTLVPRNVFKGSDKKHWFKCGDCDHEFDTSPNDIVGQDSWCPYCANIKICQDNDCQLCFNNSFASHKRAIFWHHTKNNALKPRDIFKQTHKKYWFKCDDCCHDFNMAPHNIVGQGCWCPTCVFKTEKKFKNYLTNSKNVMCYIKFIHRFRPVWANLKKTHGTSYEYDFYIEFENDLKIIVEIDGAQHYKQVSNWASPLHNQIRDYIKEKLATNEEINIYRLKQEDVLSDNNDWQNKFERFVTRKKADNKEIDIIQGYKT